MPSVRKARHSSTATEVAAATAAAIAAGELLSEGVVRQHQEMHKAPRNIVTEMDLACEQLLQRMLCGPFPAYGFLAEEGQQSAETEKDAFWIVDPLDGTTNYARGYPCYCVSIALQKAGRLVLGVVYNPSMHELFAAPAGRGATLNGRPIHVSRTAALENSLLATGFPYEASTNPVSNTQELEHMIRCTRSVRVDGSAALDLCHVAAGRLDGYWEEGLGPWDTAAGAVIAREAGGIVTHKAGDVFRPEQGSILASNSDIHAAILDALHECKTRTPPSPPERPQLPRP